MQGITMQAAVRDNRNKDYEEWSITDDSTTIMSADDDEVIFVEDYDSLKDELELLYPAIEGFSFINTRYTNHVSGRFNRIIVSDIPIAETDDYDIIIDGAKKYGKIIANNLDIPRPSGSAYLATIDDDFVYDFGTKELHFDRARNRRISKRRATINRNRLTKAKMRVSELYFLLDKIRASIKQYFYSTGSNCYFQWRKPKGIKKFVNSILSEYKIFKKLDLDKNTIIDDAERLLQYLPGLKDHDDDNYKKFGKVLEEICMIKQKAERKVNNK